MSEGKFAQSDYQGSADFIRARSSCSPKTGVILGSGLGSLADEVVDPDILPYTTIPNFPVSGAPGHAGKLYVGDLFGSPTILMQGRTHLYEGYHPQEVTFPVRVMHLLGVERLIITNAAGGLNQDFQVGELMIIDDHISFLNMGGLDPLRGPNLPGFGARFTSLNRAYDPQIKALAEKVASAENISLKKGVYAHVAGPCFETPSEVRFLKGAGADAVGMSTVPEVLVARHCGMNVLAISAITNMAIGDIESQSITTEEEVWETVVDIAPRLRALVEGVVRHLGP